jgi:hypothetical protein
MRIFGLDISLRHFGFVELDDSGSVVNYSYMIDVKKFEAIDPKHCLFYKMPKDLDHETEHFFRIKEILHFLTNQVWPTDAFTVAIEDYGYASQSTRFAEIAEQTGIVKNMFLAGGGLLRLHDPDSVKLFGAANGHALKKDMVDQLPIIDQKGSVFFPKALLKTISKKVGIKNPTKVEEYDGPGTDLTDAYWLAQLLRTEMFLRRGQIMLCDLKENQIRVFNRVTKAHPVNILDRPFARYVSC